jgi:hypothetical protein
VLGAGGGKSSVMAGSQSFLGASTSASASQILQQAQLVDSDGEGDFPDSVAGSGSGSDSDSAEDSAEFVDATSKRPILKVRMGESKLQRSSMINASTSAGAAASSMANSDMFVSAMAGGGGLKSSM